MVEMQKDGISCTLREDLIENVTKLAAEKRFDYLLIESTGISEPMPVATTFVHEHDGKALLGSVARLDTLVTVVDASSFLKDYDADQQLCDRKELGADENDQLPGANGQFMQDCRDTVRGEMAFSTLGHPRGVGVAQIRGGRLRSSLLTRWSVPMS